MKNPTLNEQEQKSQSSSMIISKVSAKKFLGLIEFRSIPWVMITPKKKRWHVETLEMRTKMTTKQLRRLMCSADRTTMFACRST